LKPTFRSRPAERLRQISPRGIPAPKDEIVDLFIHLEAYAGAARAFEMYQIAIEAFTEDDARK
jgi:hypothetical protein